MNPIKIHQDIHFLILISSQQSEREELDCFELTLNIEDRYDLWIFLVCAFIKRYY